MRRSEHWAVAATPAEASNLRRHAIAFAEEHGVCDPVLGDMRLAVAEALANAVVHAFVARPCGTIRLTVEVDPEAGGLRVVVCDDGGGMAPRHDSPGLGIGMALMARLSEELVIRVPPDGRGTEVAMAFGQLGVPCLV